MKKRKVENFTSQEARRRSLGLPTQNLPLLGLGRAWRGLGEGTRGSGRSGEEEGREEGLEQWSEV